jgi:NDP-sugar pyrophosphorylase family protein
MAGENPDTLILVGGKGTRLRSVVSDRPKPMAEAGGRPFLEWLLLELRRQGAHRVIFCSGYMSEALQAHFGDGKTWNMEIAHSIEPEPLGTAGAVRHALPLIRGKRAFILNGDSYCRLSLAKLWRAHLQLQALATIWLAKVKDCACFGTVELGKNKRILSFKEKTGESRAGLINAGVYLFERKLIETIPDGRKVSMELEVLTPLAGVDGGLFGLAGGGVFFDIGTPETYKKAQRLLASGSLA